MARDESGKFQAGVSGNPQGRPRKQVERRDGWISEASGHGTRIDRRTLARYGVDVVTDLEALQLWRSNWLAARVIEVRPRESFRRGFELKIDSKSGKSTAEKIMACAEDLGVSETLVRAAQFRRAYGGAAIFPVLDGALGSIEQPLYEDMSITAVRAFHTLEPRQLQPVAYYTDLTHPKFGRPSVYRFMPLNMSRISGEYGQLIHESRLIIFYGKQVSMQTQIGTREGWGDSELSKCYEALRDYGLSWANATTILHNFGRDVIKLKDWAELASQEGNEGIMAGRMRAFEMANSTLRLGVLDAEDDFVARGGSLAGLSETLVQQAQYVSAACEMPATVLFGMSPAGLNATGDFDMRSWYSTIENDQATEYRQPTEQVLSLLMRAQGEKIEPDVWSVEFRPLTTPTEAETAATRKVIAETDQIYVDMKATTPVMVAKSRWGGDTYSAEMSVDIAEIEEMEVEAQELADKLAENAMLPPAPAAAGEEPGGGSADGRKDEAKKQKREDA